LCLLLICQQIFDFTRSQPALLHDIFDFGKCVIAARIAIIGEEQHDQQDESAQSRCKQIDR